MFNSLPKVMLNFYRMKVVFQHSSLISEFILLLCTSFEQKKNKTKPGFCFCFFTVYLGICSFFSLESNDKMEIRTKEKKSETL